MTPLCQRDGCTNQARTGRSATKGRYCSHRCNQKAWKQAFKADKGYAYDNGDSWKYRQARKWRELRRLEAEIGMEAT